MAVYNNNGNLNSLQRQIQDLQQQYQTMTAPNTGINTIPQVQMPVQVPIPVPTRQVQYVEGIAGAKLYQDNLPANSSEIIMDRDENIFYQVSKDANGTPARRIIRCRFEVEDIQEEEPMFLTRKDFDDFKEEMRQMLMNQNQKQVTLSSGVKKE